MPDHKRNTCVHMLDPAARNDVVHLQDPAVSADPEEAEKRHARNEAVHSADC